MMPNCRLIREKDRSPSSVTALFLLLYGVILRQFAGLEVSLPVMAVYGLLGSAVTELGDLSCSL